MAEIETLEALEILDSRENPTLDVTVTLNNGVKAAAKIPSGASTGKREAMELRDGDKQRYGCKGVLKACAHVEGEMLNAVRGMDPNDQKVLDEALCQLDGTANKSRLGANAILGVSLASAWAAAKDRGLPLYAHLGSDTDYMLPKTASRSLSPTGVGVQPNRSIGQMTLEVLSHLEELCPNETRTLR